jgi:predicted TIM-barrel fold metal-dependent hydrolase
MAKNIRFRRIALTWLVAAALLCAPVSLLAQGTNIDAPDNKYSLSDDVRLGREAVAQVEQRMPVLPEGGNVDDYVERVGQRLVNGIAREFRHSQFDYEFDVVNARDINAFALPGGPLYINRGTIEAAGSEGELAGVMAHEIAHIALRHGTAQATKAQSAKFQLPAIGGAILGAIIGGATGSIIAQGTQFGLSTYFLKYSRDYERQADILGAQIMADANYDPRDLANMFQRIERQGGSGGPEWLSSHPNPGDRYDRINREARILNVSSSRATQDSVQFNRIQAELRSRPQAPSMQEIARSGAGSSARRYPTDSRIERRVEYPSTRFRTHAGGNLFSVRVPENWREFSDRDSVTFAPSGAFGVYQGESVFTHGAIVGVVNPQSNNLREASQRYVEALLQSNPYLRQQRSFRRSTIDGNPALSTRLLGRSNVTGRTEVVTVYTTMLRNGNLFYLIGVTPQDQSRVYNRAFRTMLQSLELNTREQSRRRISANDLRRNLTELKVVTQKNGTRGEANPAVSVPVAEKQSTPRAQPRPPIIDMHMHADLPPHDVPPGAPALCRPEPCRGDGQATANHAETLKRSLEMMNRYNIVKAFVSGVDLEIVQQWVDAAPGRFLAAPFILQPGRPDLNVLKQEYAAGRLHGLGEIATQLTGVPPNDPALEPYFVMAEERDLPVLIHTLGIGPYLPGFRVAAGNPLLLEDVLVRHPKLRLYVENAGYPYRGEMIAMMTQYPQLYGDVSTITWVIPRGAFYDYLEALVRAGLGKRLMFGSDQMRWPEKIGTGIEAIEQAPFLSEQQKRDILYNNAVRFLRLKQDSK